MMSDKDARVSPRRLLREYYIFIKGFFEEFLCSRLSFYAASMSWSTIFFIIPFLVILLVLFTYMPLFDTAYDKIHLFLEQSLVTSDSKVIIGYLDKFVINADKLGYIGIFYVTIAAIMFFKDYDYIVNDIYETPQRKLLDAIKTYFGLLIFLPFMLGGSFWISGKIREGLEATNLSEYLHLYLLLPYLIIWLLFYMAYQISPGVTVRKKHAMISSFIASLVWYGAKTGFVFYIAHNKTYTSIYGGLSILMFFFLWIYISWAIFLHGLRFCYVLGIQERKESCDTDSDNEEKGYGCR